AGGCQTAYGRGGGLTAGGRVAYEIYRGAAGRRGHRATDPQMGPSAQRGAAAPRLAGIDNRPDRGRLLRGLESENRMATRGGDREHAGLLPGRFGSELFESFRSV